VIGHIAESGDLEVVKTLMKELEGAYQQSFLRSAVRSGNVALLQHFLTQYETAFMANKEEYRRKAAGGDAEAKEKLANFHSWISNAGESGNVAMLRYCHEELGLPMTEAVLEDVVESGDVFAFEYVRERLRNKALTLLELSSDAMEKCSHSFLKFTLSSEQEMHSRFEKAKKMWEPVPEMGELPLRDKCALGLFMMLSMLQHPVWHASAGDSLAIISFLEKEMPKLPLLFVEKKRVKTLVKQLEVSEWIKDDAKLLERIQKLGEMFVSTEVFDNRRAMSLPNFSQS
jgi:hypothetical protein